MLDVKFIIENKEEVITRLNTRGQDFTSIINEVENKYQIFLQEKKVEESIQALINEKSKLIGEYKREGKDIEPLMQEINLEKEKLIDPKNKKLEKELEDILMTIPNMPDEEVPFGETEDDNVEEKTWGTKREFSFEPKQHFELEEGLKMLNFDRASKVAKSRFVIQTDKLAKLERALSNFMLDIHSKNGYTEFSIPLIVNEDTLKGSGQLPKFENDLFKIARSTDEEDEFCENTRDFYLIPTGEVVLANFHRDEIIDGNLLPFNYTTYSQCFRKEAGSAGRDTRGLIRLHQFGKVELFKYCKEEDSFNELEKMVLNAEEILEALKLPYRRVTLCSGDMGFGAAKTYDLEVWLPGQSQYRECSSCSNVTDFQARRAKIRYKENGKNKYVHMLNGSGMATGRILAAIVENYQNEDGTIEVPKVLKEYIK